MGGLFTTFLFWGARDVLMGASQNHCFVIPLMNGRATCVRCLCLEVKVSHAYRVNYSSLARTSAFVVWRRYNYAPQVRKRDEQIIIEGPWSQGWDYPIPVRSNPRARASIGCLSVCLSVSLPHVDTSQTFYFVFPCNFQVIKVVQGDAKGTCLRFNKRPHYHFVELCLTRDREYRF